VNAGGFALVCGRGWGIIIESMRNRRVYLIPILLGMGILVSALAVGIFWSREPEYRGRTLTSWITQRDNDQQAEDAIRHIGTKALPFALKWIRYEAVPWKNSLYSAVNSVLAGWNVGWELTDEKEARAEAASWVFLILGTEAQKAIPELTGFLNERKSAHGAERAARALSFLGKDGLPPLIAVLTNAEAGPVRLAVLSRLPFMGTNCLVGLPALLECLGDTNETIVEGAATAFYNMRSEPTLVIHWLGQGLSDFRPSVRGWTSFLLGCLGTEARSAVPALLKLRNDPDFEVRHITTNALLEIDPEALKHVRAE